MSDEREKAERLVSAYEKMLVILPMMDGQESAMSDAVEVCRAYLSDLAAREQRDREDHLPVSEERLLALLFVPYKSEGGGRYWERTVEFQQLDTNEETVSWLRVHEPQDEWWPIELYQTGTGQKEPDGVGLHSWIEKTTMGQVRRLLAALGSVEPPSVEKKVVERLEQFAKDIEEVGNDRDELRRREYRVTTVVPAVEPGEAELIAHRLDDGSDLTIDRKKAAAMLRSLSADNARHAALVKRLGATITNLESRRDSEDGESLAFCASVLRAILVESKDGAK